MSQEFLPLCDVLFNIISLAAYFCDVVFDAVTVYSLYEQKKYAWFMLTACFVISTQLACQVCSLRWYIRRNNCDVRTTLTSGKCHADPKKNCDVGFTLILHILQCGIVGRYLKLLIPVDIKFVKHDVRDLCLLRLIHGFCEAMPMLLIQLYLIWLKNDEEISNLNCVSTALSLFSVCWALAAFNKNIRKKNIHKFVMTWLGVIFQLFWRLGTITSRVISLTIYASLYHHWTFLVVALHWTCMFFWLIFPRHSSEPLSKRVLYSSLLAYIYTFCYVNVSETRTVARMVVFYVVMLLENLLLVGVWIIGANSALLQDETPLPTGYARKNEIIAFVLGTFGGGMVFLLLYYRYFHVRRLKYKGNRAREECANDGASEAAPATTPNVIKPVNATNRYPPLSGSMAYNHDLLVPGVFSCRLNRGIKRKKKKPTSFVPPPSVQPLMQPAVKNHARLEAHKFRPWWHASSDHDRESVGSRVNIQQKLREKKEQQLAELRVIEEEIKQGKLQRPVELEAEAVGAFQTVDVEPPKNKRPPWLVMDMDPPPRQPSFDLFHDHRLPAPPDPRSNTPEILLSPYYLDNSQIYGVAGNRVLNDVPEVSFFPGGEGEVEDWNPGLMTPGGAVRGYRRNHRHGRHMAHVPSDIDSQISLPRSYTLPREFKYSRKPKTRKVVRAELFLSTNSSDGDVDSAEDDGEMDDDDDGMFSNVPLPLQMARPAIYYYNYSMRNSSNHETPL